MTDHEAKMELYRELQAYANLDRTEFGEGTGLIAALLRRDVGLSDECEDALIDEAQRRLQWYEEHTEIEAEEVRQHITRLKRT